MTLFRAALLSAILTLTALPAAHAQSSLIDAPGISFTGEDAAALRRAVEDYFWGRQAGDRDRLARAFQDDGRLTGLQQKDGATTLRNESLGEFRARMSPLAEDTAGVIVDLDIVEGRMAWVKLTLDSKSRFFNDYLMFYKIDGQWRLVNKMFTLDRKS